MAYGGYPYGYGGGDLGEMLRKEDAARKDAQCNAKAQPAAQQIGVVGHTAPPLPQPSIVDVVTEGRFFFVWAEFGGAPTVKHATLEAAEKEADRLARSNAGRRFFVLSNIESVIINAQPKPPAVWRSARA